MACVFAIFLNTGMNFPIKSRLVLTHAHEYNPLYSIHAVDSSFQFPLPNVDSSVYVTESPVRGPGTYLAAYCSIQRDGKSIFYLLREKWTSLVHNQYIRAGNEINLTPDCLRFIREIWKPERYFTKIHTNQLLMTRKCSEKKLVDLALQGHITINGNYGLHTSTRYENAPVVIFDEPLKIKRVILDNSFISMAKYNGLKYALAWYQGHPHVFSRRLDEEIWHLVTGVGKDADNANEICQFLLESSPPLAKYSERINRLELQYMSLRKFAGEKWLEIGPAKLLDMDDQGRGLQVKLHKIVPQPARGFICGNIS
ncbi:putative Bgh-specific protein [Blumeria hordei DH14]|uniref:Putative Bgh-specific protein n=1 Tax=Blumeria graminis f. sp. hordei (strain DH14) TaxID=546991 RepID=N1J7P4_BLUG1|nr:putative Bgh-specific protein [Blumeria hordei DH14]